MKSAARGPLSSVVMLGHRVHTALARRALAAGYRTFCVHDLRLSRRRWPMHRIATNSLTCDPSKLYLGSVCSDLTLDFNITPTARRLV